MSESWIKLFRKFRDWEWYQNSNVKDLFIELLLTANFEDRRWQGIEIKRGQLLTGIEELGKRIGLNRQQTRSAIDKLISTKEVTKSSTATYTIITIINYDKYQEITKEVTNEQPSRNQVVTTTKEYKNIKSKEEREYTKLSYLLNIPSKDLGEIAKDLGVSEQTISLKGKDLYDYCEAKGKVYKNYKAFLRNCVRKDHPKNITPAPGLNFNSLPIKQ